MKAQDLEDIYTVVKALITSNGITKEYLAKELQCSAAYLPTKLDRIKTGDITLIDIERLEVILKTRLVILPENIKTFIDAQRSLSAVGSTPEIAQA